MLSESAIPFFVYNKHRKEAYFIVLSSSKISQKQSGGVDYDREGIIQESKLSRVPRYALGA